MDTKYEQTTNEWRGLSVVGCVGDTRGTDIPLLVIPVLMNKDGKFFHVAHDEKGEHLEMWDDFDRQSFDASVERYELTPFGPVPASSDHCLYVVPDEVDPPHIEYITWREAAECYKAFEKKQRRLGHEFFLNGNYNEAALSYAKAASASERALDYALMLLCDRMSGEDDTDLCDAIKKQGKNPEKLVERVKNHLNFLRRKTKIVEQ